MITLALYSNKGGVGKTTAAVNLAYLASQSGARTLVWDLDPQSSATYYFRVKSKLKAGARGLMKAGRPIDRSIKGTDYEGLDILPADFTHRNLDITFDRLKNSKHRLGKILDLLKYEYDLVFLDSPPTINIVAENIFNAADFLIVPMIPTTLSLRTYQQVLKFLNKEDLDAGRVYTFFSMVDRRKNMHNELMAEVRGSFPRVFRTPIPYLSLIERMGDERQPVPAFAPNSGAAAAYEKLWDEIRQAIIDKILSGKPAKNKK
jgi:cellulose biosynthesis protein BcsQ